jgi:hypothetical protein
VPVAARDRERWALYDRSLQAEMEREIVRLWEESRGPEGIEHRLTVFRWFTGRNPFCVDAHPTGVYRTGHELWECTGTCP